MSFLSHANITLLACLVLNNCLLKIVLYVLFAEHKSNSLNNFIKVEKLRKKFISLYNKFILFNVIIINCLLLLLFYS